MLSPTAAIDSLKHGQFREAVPAAEWAELQPIIFELVERRGKFVLLVELGCGCMLPIFYEATQAAMADGTKRDVLVSRVAQPKDWDAACPFRALPERAVGQTILGIRLPWGHGSVKMALEALDAGN